MKNIFLMSIIAMLLASLVSAQIVAEAPSSGDSGGGSVSAPSVSSGGSSGTSSSGSSDSVSTGGTSSGSFGSPSASAPSASTGSSIASSDGVSSGSAPPSIVSPPSSGAESKPPVASSTDGISPIGQIKTDEVKGATNSSNVTPPSISYYSIEPSSAELEVGQQQEFQVIYHTGQYEIVVPDSQIGWWVSNTSVGTVDANGVFSAISIGVTRVHAILLSMVNSSQNSLYADVKVVESAPPPPTGPYLEVSPASASLDVGQSQEFTAIFHSSNGNIVEVPVQWSTSGGIGTVTDGGVFTATTAGSGEVIALYDPVIWNGNETFTASAQVTVTSSPPPNGTAYLEISPASASLTVGQAQQFTAIFHSSNGNIVEVPVQWSTSGGIGTVTDSGIFTATSAGSGQVIAVYHPVIWTGNETYTAIAQVTVTSSPPPPPSGNYITITPSSASLAIGSTLDFDVVYHTGGLEMPVPDEQVGWSIDNPAVRSMASGTFTANAEGTAVLTATYSPPEGTTHYSANATVTVSSGTVPPSGGDGGSTGGTGGGSSNNGGGMYKTSTTASFTCAGKSGSVKITYLVSGSPQAIIQIFYLGNGNREQVLSRTVTGTSGFDFAPARAGSYEVRVSLGADQQSAYFTVPACSPGEEAVAQNVTVRLEPKVELILSKSVDYGNGFIKKFEVYRLTDGKTESYRTDILLSYLSNDNYSNATVADGIPKSVLASQGLVTFRNKPVRFDTSKETGFEWDVSSIANGERLTWSYSFARPLTEQMISTFSAPRLVVGRVEPVSGEDGGVGSLLAASIGAIAGLDAMAFVIAIVLIIAFAYLLIFGRKKNEEY